MNYIAAVSNLESFKNNGNLITPMLANDWIMSIDYRSNKSRSNLIVKSETLDCKIDCGETGSFLANNVMNGYISISRNKIEGMVAYSKNGFITEEDYFISEDLIERKSKYEVIKPAAFKYLSLYKDLNNDYYIYIGEPSFKKLTIYKNSLSSVIQNIMGKTLIKIDTTIFENDNKIVFEKSIKRTPKIKLIEEIKELDVEIENKIFLFLSNQRTLIGIFPNTNRIIIKDTVVAYAPSIILFEEDYYLYEEMTTESDEVIKKEYKSAKLMLPCKANEEMIRYNTFRYKKIKDIDTLRNMCIQYTEDKTFDLSELVNDELYLFPRKEAVSQVLFI